jgi:hypothetical protein
VSSTSTYTARARGALGRSDEGRALLDGLEERDDYVRSEFMAAGWAALGDLDRAFAALDRAYADRSAGLIYLHVDPSYDALRGDPRYQEMVDKVGLRTG